MYYLSNYQDSNGNQNRICSPASTTKVDYISDLLACSGKDILIVSPTMTAEQNNKTYPAYFAAIREKIHVQYFKSVAYSSSLKRKIQFLKTIIKVFFYIKNRVKSNEKVLVYHNLSWTPVVIALKLFSKAKVVLEVEEIYQDVIKVGFLKRWLEYTAFKCADAYIFSTKNLEEKLNAKNKPYVVINGTYKSEPFRGKTVLDDSKIHCVYAGTFDPVKGGASAAIEAAKFLPENYHVHILGFGTKAEVETITGLVDTVNRQAKCTVTYDGLLGGEDYTVFLQSCQIGLCTQIPDAVYAETSFPSKVLVYMANGLRVVSARFRAIETSDIGDLVYYYDEQDAQNIAKTIMAMNFNDDYNPRLRLQQLDQKTKTELNHLLTDEV